MVGQVGIEPTPYGLEDRRAAKTPRTLWTSGQELNLQPYGPKP